MGDYIPTVVVEDAYEGTGNHARSTINTNQLISQLKAVAENPDTLKGASDSQLQDLRRYCREADERFEKPFETLRRMAYSPLKLVVPHIAQEHGIFEIVNKATEPVSLAHLSEETKISRNTLESIMDYLCTQRMARQVGSEEFESTKLSHRLMEQAFLDGFIHFHDILYLGWGWLRKMVREPLPERTAFQMSYNTDLDFYEYLERDDMKVEREAFHRFMKTNMTGLPSWLDKVDIKSELTDGLTDTDVAFVDVGGGNGHQCVELKEKIPDLPGRVILQDRPDILAKSLDAEGIEKMEYDYNNEQPIKDARVYYFRYVFHNCSDETGLRIIRNHIPAMGPKSVMVIDENVLPDDKPAPGTPGAEASAGLSLAMKMIFNSQERRKGQWQTLFQGSGLAIKDIRQYTDLTESAIILAKEA